MQKIQIMEMMPVYKVILVHSTKIAKDFKNWKNASGEMLQVNRWSEYWILLATLELLCLSTRRKVYMQDMPQALETGNFILQSWRAKLPILSERTS